MRVLKVNNAGDKSDKLTKSGLIRADILVQTDLLQNSKKSPQLQIFIMNWNDHCNARVRIIKNMVRAFTPISIKP